MAGDTLEAIPASTLILMRDQPAGAPEILMIQRGDHLAFAGGNMVFPGGRVDQDDGLIAQTPALLIDGEPIDHADLVARIAAIRETIEEIGLAPGVVGFAHQEQLDDVRASLRGDALFSALLEKHGLKLDPYQLYPFSHWLPQIEIVRRFDTRFYIARAPELGEARADGDESSRSCWDTATAHIAAGRLMFPTKSNLQRVAQANSFDHAVAFFAGFPNKIVSPWPEDRDGIQMLCIPDDLGYPVTSAPYDEVIRSRSHAARPGIQREPG